MQRKTAESQHWMPRILGASDSTALKTGMILSWISLHGLKNTSINHLSVRTVHRAIHKCRLKLYYAKKKPCVNIIQKQHHVLWARARLKWTEAKW